MKKPEDIVNTVAAELPFSKKLIKEVVNKTFRNIDERMKNKENIMLRGFMKFVCASDKKTKTYSMDEYKRLKTKDK